MQKKVAESNRNARVSDITAYAVVIKLMYFLGEKDGHSSIQGMVRKT
jgi:hypothetical protein